MDIIVCVFFFYSRLVLILLCYVLLAQDLCSVSPFCSLSLHSFSLCACAFVCVCISRSNCCHCTVFALLALPTDVVRSFVRSFQLRSHALSFNAHHSTHIFFFWKQYKTKPLRRIHSALSPQLSKFLCQIHMKHLCFNFLSFFFWIFGIRFECIFCGLYHKLENNNSFFNHRLFLKTKWKRNNKFLRMLLHTDFPNAEMLANVLY